MKQPYAMLGDHVLENVTYDTSFGGVAITGNVGRNTKIIWLSPEAVHDLTELNFRYPWEIDLYVQTGR